MTFTPEFWLQLLIAVATAGGTYAAIRSDLATLHERTKNTDRRVSDLATIINDRRNNHG